MDNLLNKGRTIPSAADLHMLLANYNLNELYSNFNTQNELNFGSPNMNELLLANNLASIKTCMDFDANTSANINTNNLNARNQAVPFFYKMNQNICDESTCGILNQSSEFHRPLSFMDNTCAALNLFDKSQKYIRDPISHRLVEKRRRDRMNKQLARLRDTLPAHMAKRGSVRIEKAEIVEMAIEYINLLKQQVQHFRNSQAEGNSSSNPETSTNDESEEIMEAQSVVNAPTEVKKDISELEKILNEKCDEKTETFKENKPNQTEIRNDKPCFKNFKKEISSRFKVNELSDATDIGQNITREPSVSIIGELQVSNHQDNVLVYAAHPMRSHYVPLLIQRNLLNQLSPYYSQLPNHPRGEDICHPITIQVDFVGNLTLPLITFRN